MNISSLMKALWKRRELGAVIVCPVEAARDAAIETKAGLIASIADPELRGKVRGWIGRGRWACCELDFHDIERPAPGLVEPQERHLVSALAAGKSTPAHLPIIVHCQAGISRSSAMALVLSTDRAMSFGVDADEAIDRAIEELKTHAPHARPNMRIIELASDHLNLQDAGFTDKAWRLHC
jgi:predicted protein tyrosine phosphatase